MESSGYSSKARPDPWGTAAVQLARYFEAHVTAVRSTKNLELGRSLGANEIIDYTQQDFTRNGQTYDVIFAASR
jgi:NADPH:quinone reductase-like Zn-dependent oxidoreductase